MEFSQEWKSLFPISSSTQSPLLLTHSDSNSLGPLFFNPNPLSLSLLFSSNSLFPPLHLPPHLLTNRFLSTSDPSILPSTASTVASLFHSPHQHNNNVSHFLHNRIQLIQYPDSPNTLVFFPTGSNDEKIGFFMLGIKDSVLLTRFDTKGDIFIASSGSMDRIVNFSANPVTHSEMEGGNTNNSSFVIGYLFASTLYSVNWFVMKHNLILDVPAMCYLGRKVFKETVVHVCWSPHILEESLVLLESGLLFLFDLESQGSKSFKGTRLRVPWNDFNCCDDNMDWLSCEFSWHPRILIVARSDAVFLVDLRLKECNVTCLMKIEMLRMYAPDDKERFLALSKAGPDDFYFTVASSSLLVLCDVRKPLMPILQWKHNIDDPSYMSVLSLSMLRSHSKVDTFKLASQSGFCIILGSFWNSEFNIFCYGPAYPFRKGSINSQHSKINKTFCAWELPYEINISSECRCGSCLFKEELSKDALPEWVDWQLKKEMVLGFGILNNDLASLLCEPDEHGGFTLIRLMSSGKFELQRYHASLTLSRNLEDCYKPLQRLESHLLCPLSDEKSKIWQKFRYLKLDYLYAYANGNLTEFLTTKLEKICLDDQEEVPLCEEVHESLCKKLNACGLGSSRSCPSITSVFKDVKLPASFHEVAFRRLWTDLPLELLQLAFLSYSECREFVRDNENGLPLEFSAVPDLPQLPPFFLRKPSPHSSDDIVGPVIPFPVLLMVNEVRYGYSNLQSDEFSVEAELGLKYKEVMQVAVSLAGYKPPDDAVSLADDEEEPCAGSSKPKSFLSYRPVALNNFDADNVQEGNTVYTDTIYDTFVFHVLENSCEQKTDESVGEEMFDDLCPVELRFDAPVKKFEHNSLKAYNALKRKMSMWQKSFDLYKEFCIQSGFEKVVN